MDCHLYIWSTKIYEKIGWFKCPGTIIDVQQNKFNQLIVTSNKGLFVIEEYNSLDAVTDIYKDKDWSSNRVVFKTFKTDEDNECIYMIGGTKEGGEKNNIFMTCINKNEYDEEDKEDFNLVIKNTEDVKHEMITLRLNPSKEFLYVVVKSIKKNITETKDKKGKVKKEESF